MKLTDGRRVEHELGPRRLHGTEVSLIDTRFFRPMPDGASWSDDKARAWLRGAGKTPAERAAEDRAYNLAHRLANLEHYRRLERERARRHRARQRYVRGKETLTPSAPFRLEPTGVTLVTSSVEGVQ